jgi:Sulfatase
LATELGFEKFYGFISGDMNQWSATVFDGRKAIEPYVGHPDYNLDYDLADQAIQYINEQHALAPEKPFFVYYAPRTTYAPHHPRKEWVENSLLASGMTRCLGLSVIRLQSGSAFRSKLSTVRRSLPHPWSPPVRALQNGSTPRHGKSSKFWTTCWIVRRTRVAKPGSARVS